MRTNQNRIKTTQKNPRSPRPDGRPYLEEQGYPNGPQNPFGTPCEGQPLRTPDQTKPERPTRDRVIKIRLTADELNQLAVPLPIRQGKRCGLSQLVRSRLFGGRKGLCSASDCPQCRLLVAVVNNLNLIAHRSLDIADPDTTVQVIAHLLSLEREIRSTFDHSHA